MIEKVFGDKEYSETIKRRIVTGFVGMATLVDIVVDVVPENGKFLK